MGVVETALIVGSLAATAKVASDAKKAKKAAKLSAQPLADIANERKAARRMRTQIFATEGGSAGSELSPAQGLAARTPLGN
jgi:hypothetical protein